MHGGEDAVGKKELQRSSSYLGGTTFQKEKKVFEVGKKRRLAKGIAKICGRRVQKREGGTPTRKRTSRCGPEKFVTWPVSELAKKKRRNQF